ncbi:uncharacterized protein MONBRDRAFT_12385 [Monosiga brevicollis MX1]|uniref:Protein kinase domain-containing protein n=1 Tax=Monosiga brevicollis TaxID=81824 RepID=A9VC41_MONBE|nr:uncharacterized protein MONBRDRAFT_12385 [Monosiga brevicollis MX1]EDQ84916.1 predicted protein [Monosiga brevicollis MX1]|eukprot:XP_001750257.1 hypothetical protein [Monosiga brevicollis MX1]
MAIQAGPVVCALALAFTALVAGAVAQPAQQLTGPGTCANGTACPYQWGPDGHLPSFHPGLDATARFSYTPYIQSLLGDDYDVMHSPDDHRDGGAADANCQSDYWYNYADNLTSIAEHMASWATASNTKLLFALTSAELCDVGLDDTVLRLNEEAAGIMAQFHIPTVNLHDPIVAKCGPVPQQQCFGLEALATTPSTAPEPVFCTPNHLNPYECKSNGTVITRIPAGFLCELACISNTMWSRVRCTDDGFFVSDPSGSLCPAYTAAGCTYDLAAGALSCDGRGVSPEDKLTNLIRYSGHTELRSLDFQYQYIRAISNNDMHGLRGLRKLRVASSHISALEGTLFITMPHVQSIDLAYNVLDTITPGMMMAERQLRFINLTGNPITAIEAGAFNYSFSRSCSVSSTIVLDDTNCSCQAAPAPHCNTQTCSCLGQHMGPAPVVLPCTPSLTDGPVFEQAQLCDGVRDCPCGRDERFCSNLIDVSDSLFGRCFGLPVAVDVSYGLARIFTNDSNYTTSTCFTVPLTGLGWGLDIFTFNSETATAIWLSEFNINLLGRLSIQLLWYPDDSWIFVFNVTDVSPHVQEPLHQVLVPDFVANPNASCDLASTTATPSEPALKNAVSNASPSTTLLISISLAALVVLALATAVFLYTRRKPFAAFTSVIPLSPLVNTAQASLNIVHRDVAARNVLLLNAYVLGSHMQTPMVKLGDFGHARLLHSGEATVASEDGFAANPALEAADYYLQQSTITVASRWHAPEVLRSQRFSLSSDVWSFGVFLHELTTLGTVPYADIQSEQECISRILQGLCLHPPPGSPTAVAQAMQRCLSKDPHRRGQFEALHESFQAEIAERQQESEL